jgi:hypothetical protein
MSQNKFKLRADGTKDYGDLSSVDPPYQIPMSCSRCRTVWRGCADARDCPECGGDGEGFPDRLHACSAEVHAALREDTARMASECDYVGIQELEDEPSLHLWNHRACWSTISGPPPRKPHEETEKTT